MYTQYMYLRQDQPLSVHDTVPHFTYKCLVVSVRHDSRVVEKDIIPASGRRDKSEPLAVGKPLDCSSDLFGHVVDDGWKGCG
jgi:hypothetical protein